MTNTRKLEGSITATGPTDGRELNRGTFQLMIGGTFTADIAVEVKIPGTSTWVVVDTYNSPVVKHGTNSIIDGEYRLNCTSFTSGAVIFSLVQ